MRVIDWLYHILYFAMCILLLLLSSIAMGYTVLIINDTRIEVTGGGFGVFLFVIGYIALIVWAAKVYLKLARKGGSVLAPK